MSELCDRIDYGFTASADSSIREPRFLRITDIQDGAVNWDGVPGCAISPAEEGAHRLAEGDIVFARTGATTGKSFLIKDPPRAVFASYLIRLRLNGQVLPDYLYTFFQSEGYWRQIRASARGGAQPNVNATLLGALIAPLPSSSAQQRVVSEMSARLQASQRLRRDVEAQLDALNALPAALLRRAFSGAL